MSAADQAARADVVTLPDADQTPEQVAGLSPGVDPAAAEREMDAVLAELRASGQKV